MPALSNDWKSQFCDSPYKATTRTIALSFCDRTRNGWIGRRLPRVFRQVGMADITVSFRSILVSYDFLQLLLGGHIVRMVSAGTLSKNEADLWFARSSSEGTFHYSLTASVVSGARL